MEDKLIPQPLPEAQEVFYPEPDWSNRFFNWFDWFRAQTKEIREAAIMQWVCQGIAHQLTVTGSDPSNRSELYYVDNGKFFVQIGFVNGVICERMNWFISESCLKLYGAEVIGKVKELQESLSKSR